MDSGKGAGDGAEVTVSSQEIYSGRVVKLRVDTVRLPDGRTAKREIVEHRGAVAMVALDAQGNVLLVRQYRKPVERSLLEIPAGTLDPGEDPEHCARRELAEETGYRPGRLSRLTGFYSAPGFCSEYLHVFLATELMPVESRPEDDENLELVRAPLADCVRLIRDGDICDAKSIVGILAAQAGWGDGDQRERL